MKVHSFKKMFTLIVIVLYVFFVQDPISFLILALILSTLVALSIPGMDHCFCFSTLVIHIAAGLVKPSHLVTSALLFNILAINELVIKYDVNEKVFASLFPLLALFDSLLVRKACFWCHVFDFFCGGMVIMLVGTVYFCRNRRNIEMYMLIVQLSVLEFCKAFIASTVLYFIQ